MFFNRFMTPQVAVIKKTLSAWWEIATIFFLYVQQVTFCSREDSFPGGPPRKGVATPLMFFHLFVADVDVPTETASELFPELWWFLVDLPNLSLHVVTFH